MLTLHFLLLLNISWPISLSECFNLIAKGYAQIVSDVSVDVSEVLGIGLSCLAMHWDT
jgi:hypothetical protein